MHTPGPWERSNPDEVHGWVRFHSPITSCVIAECGPHNADLVESSPIMLDALRTAKAAMAERRSYSDAWEWKYRDEWDFEDSIIDQAIAMAEGRSRD